MERDFKGFRANGFLMLFLFFVVLGGLIFLGISMIDYSKGLAVTIFIIDFFVSLFWLIGFKIIEPNTSRVMMFFGEYKGTYSRLGYSWVNPFMDCKKLSLRARNLDVKPIKVNDKVGNPIMIGLVLVWKVKDTYKCMFDVDSETMAEGINVSNSASRMKALENFVSIQSDSALRQVAGNYAYDESEGVGEEVTLRSGVDEINEQLVEKLNERLELAGIGVVEARINYLAYAPEIAAIMLRRQQASAIIMAREKIVDGAVSMVKLALDKLEDEKVVELTPDKKAQMVSNLLVVLCADESARPVVNTDGN